MNFESPSPICARIKDRCATTGAAKRVVVVARPVKVVGAERDRDGANAVEVFIVFECECLCVGDLCAFVCLVWCVVRILLLDVDVYIW